MEFQMGDKVEVIGHEVGFTGSFYAAKVISKRGKKYKVEYETLLKDDLSGPLQTTVVSAYLRPMPPEASQTEYNLNEMVDGYDNEGWWFGIIKKAHVTDYLVYFPSSDEKILLPLDKLRIHLSWSNIERKWEACEVYKERMRKTRPACDSGDGGNGAGSGSSTTANPGF